MDHPNNMWNIYKYLLLKSGFTSNQISCRKTKELLQKSISAKWSIMKATHQSIGNLYLTTTEPLTPEKRSTFKNLQPD